MLQVRLLGQFDVRRDGTPIAIPSRAAQSLFAYLILTAGTMHRREKLAGLLWPDTTDEHARHNLRQELWRLRKALEIKTPRKKSVAHLVVDEISIGFEAQSDYWLDVALVKQAVAEPASADDFIQALALYQGELLPGLYDDWVVLERERVRAVYEQKMTRLLELLVEEKRWQAVLEWGERWIALGQTPEPAYRALMVAHRGLGNMAQVAAVYARCIQVLREDLGVEPSAETRSLFERLSKNEMIPERVGTRVSPPATILQPGPLTETTSTPSSTSRLRFRKLPVPLTSFVGREREIEQVKALFAGTRLLSLIGAGGIGKTRLAIRLATELSGEYPEGAGWVDLVPLSDPALVPQAVAKALGVREETNVELIETLADALCSSQVLLVLDNCEHLIGACAQLAESLLRTCASLRILATSRESLGISGETIWRVPSLSFPDPDPLPSLNDLEQYESIRLFTERARAAKPDFTLTPQNALAIVRICRRLDGIPLAIELAAARVRHLDPGEIETRLDNCFGLLTTGSRTALPRQQTLRATIDWSYDLLAGPERILFRRLSVFAGGFTLPAAEQVCAAEGLAVLESLGRLVDKSFVILDPLGATGETRYRLLETIRQYALEKLIETGETPTIRGRHLGYYLALAEESEPKMFSSESALWFLRLDQELDNIRAAIDWSTTTGKADGALQIAGALVYFWFAHGLVASEWHDRVQQALARPEGRERTLARAKALNGIGFMYWADTYPVERRPELEEALSISRELGDPWNTATALRNLGLLENIRGNYRQARTMLDESLAIWRQMGLAGKTGSAWTLNFLGDAALNHGEAESARSLYEETIAILRETGDMNYLAYAVRRLGQLLWHEGDYEKATALCNESLNINQQVGDPRGVIGCLAGFAAIAVAQGKYQHAAPLMAAVEIQVTSTRIRLLYMDKLEYERNLARLRAKLDEKVLARSWSQGKVMTLDQAIAYALEETP